MTETRVTHSWLNSVTTDAVAGSFDAPHEISRQWQGFMTARLVLGLVLVVLQTALYATGTSHSQAQIAISAAYLTGTLASKLFIQPRPLFRPNSTDNR